MKKNQSDYLQNSPDIFPHLNFSKLKTLAKRWVESYPKIPITRITLYTYSETELLKNAKGEVEVKYAVIFEHPQGTDEEAFRKFRYDTAQAGELDKGIFSADFTDVYKQPTTRNYQNEWLFYSVLNEDEILPGIRVNEPHWVLFDVASYEPLPLYEIAFRLAGKEPQSRITDPVVSYVLDELLKHATQTDNSFKRKLVGWYHDEQIQSDPPFEANKEKAREIYITRRDFLEYCCKVRLPRRHSFILNGHPDRKRIEGLERAHHISSGFAGSEAELRHLIEVLRLKTDPSPEERLMANWPEKQASTEKVSQEVNENFKYSDGYRSVTIRGELFTLTSKQAQIIQKLHEEYMHGTAEVGQGCVIQEVSPNSKINRLKDFFKKDSKAWKALVRKGIRKDMFRLNL